MRATPDRSGSAPKRAMASRKASAQETTVMSPRRRQVLDVATRLFHERGYQGTSMDDVAANVGLTKGTLYHHFPGKAEILEEIYTEAPDFVLGRIDQHPEDATAGQIIRLLFHDILELISERPYMITVFYQEMRWIGEWLAAKSAREIQRKNRRYIDYVEATVQRGIDDGEFREVDSSVTAYSLIGMASWTYQWFNPDGRLSTDEVADIMAGIFLEGLASTVVRDHVGAEADSRPAPGKAPERGVTAPP